MIILNQVSQNTVNVELLPELISPNWLFVFEFDDLNTNEVKSFIIPTFESERYYTFIVDTNTVVLSTGEWVLRVYEKANTNDTDTDGLEVKYISKVRIYESFTSPNYNDIDLQDERIS